MDFQLQRQGYITLQIPDISITLPTKDKKGSIDDASPSEVKIHPEWFWRINGSRLALGKESGFLFLSRVGYEQNKDKIKKAFEAALAEGLDRTEGRGWAAFEDHAEEFFKTVENKTRKRLLILKKKKDELENLINNTKF